MQLFRVQIENYRNFDRVDCRFGRHVVLLGENGSGKSNLLKALRLVLDPELPDSDRYLDSEDFWSGIRPFAGNEIKITIDFSGFDDEPAILACLADYEIQPPEGFTGPVARLTYHYAPKSSVAEADRANTTKDDYEYSIYGKDDRANEIRRDIQRALVFKLLHALRDAENDLRMWRRSPLRPLLEEVIPILDPAMLQQVITEMDNAAAHIGSQVPLETLRNSIQSRVNEMIGQQHPLAPTLGFSSTDPTQLLRSLKLFVDVGRRWEISNTSLGLANVIYLALLLLYVKQQEENHRIAVMLLGVEEPEAHLHPQMQRQVFRDLLKRKHPLLVSTHSPNIASVAPLDSIVMLKTQGNKSILKSMAGGVGFSAQQLEDVSRYLDVTRAEILFSRGVILVEGDSEKFIIPTTARLLNPSIELDNYGISVCSVSGTDFIPYVKLLQNFGIPYVVITDGDKKDTDGTNLGGGIKRATDILISSEVITPGIQGEILGATLADARARLQGLNIFVGDRTLESDMLAAGAAARMTAAYLDIQPGTLPQTLSPLSQVRRLSDGEELEMISLVKRVGKGRFAQRLSSLMLINDAPPYIQHAIFSIVRQCTHV